VPEPNSQRVALYTSHAVEIMEHEAGGLSRRPQGTSPKARRLRLIEFALASEPRAAQPPSLAETTQRCRGEPEAMALRPALNTIVPES
jgi:hypothetical protein